MAGRITLKVFRNYGGLVFRTFPRLVLLTGVLCAAGLTLADQQKIYVACLTAHEEAIRLADKKVPKNDPEIRKDVLVRNGEVYEREYDRLIAPTLKRFHIEDWQTERIMVDGARSHWPKK